MCEVCKWKDYLLEIDKLRKDYNYRFAYDIINGIHSWVSQCKHITEKQVKALTNIQNGLSKGLSKSVFKRL